MTVLDSHSGNDDEPLSVSPVREVESPEAGPDAIYLTLRDRASLFSAGISEYTLIGWLKEQGLVDEDYQRNAMQLYETHFVLFNALYRLQELWLEQGVGALQISPLSIHLLPISDVVSEPTGKVLQEQDESALRAYYLDWQNLIAQSELSVQNMLAGFWQRMQATDHVDEALAVLGLQQPVTHSIVRKRYRQLAMLWHPDRGGTVEKIQELNAAMAVLDDYFKPARQSSAVSM